MRKPIAPALLELLLLTRPLIDHATGDKKTALKRAWINAMNDEASEMLGLTEGRLPQSQQAAIREMLRLNALLAKAAGMSGPDLAQFYNDSLDSGALMKVPDIDHAITRGFAILGALAAQRMTAQLPDDTSAERAAV